MKLYETIQDERLKRAVKKVLRDNGYKLHFIPATMTGRHHPIDERGYDGLMKHTEKVAWFLDQVCRQLNYSNEVRDILLTAAYFHDLGKIKQTKIIQEVKYSKGKIEREVKAEKPKADRRIKIKTKLSYRDQQDLDILPDQIEKLEIEIETINRCLYDPECYQEKGLVTLTEELQTLQESYDEISDRYLEVLELQEELEG